MVERRDSQPAHRSVDARGDRLVGVGLGLACATVLALATGLVEGGNGFSPDLSLRLQTEALLRGELALQPHPYDGMPDWMWGRGGLHQNWSMGIPLLRLPADAAARAFGAVGFPDRILFLALHAFACALLFSGLRRLWVGRAGPARVAAALGAVFLALFPGFVVLVASRFAVYEEVIATGFLWTLLLLGLLLRFRHRPTAGTLAILAAACAFAPLVRITGLFAGGLTFAIALGLAWRARLGWRALAFASLVAALGPLAVMGLNTARTGRPLEFGYALVLTRPFTASLQRFENPYREQSPWRAFVEVLDVAFPAEHPHGSPYELPAALAAERGSPPRFREVYFAPFPRSMGLLALLSLVLWAGTRLRRRVLRLAGAPDPPREDLVTQEGIDLIASFGAVLTFVFTGFYLWTNSIASRYVAELGPGLAALLLAGALQVVAELPRERPWLRRAVVAGLLMLAATWWGGRQRTFPYRFETPIAASTLAQKLPRVLRPAPAMAPESALCGVRPPSARRIFWNLGGWAADCRFAPGLQIALPASPCVMLHFSSLGAGSALSDAEAAEGIRVRSDLRDLALEASVRDEEGVRLHFCEQKPAEWRLAGLQLVSLWHAGHLEPRLVEVRATLGPGPSPRH